MIPLGLFVLVTGYLIHAKILTWEDPIQSMLDAASLRGLERFEEALSLLRKIVPVARRVLGEGHRVTLKTRWSYGLTLYMDPGATLDDLNEAVTTLEDARRIALRVFGGAHPVTGGLGRDLCKARFTLSIRGETDGETPSLGST